MDHPLEVARQRLQVDGKPHPTAPSHPQAPKPVGALQLGVRSLDTSPYVIPLSVSHDLWYNYWGQVSNPEFATVLKVVRTLGRLRAATRVTCHGE